MAADADRGEDGKARGGIQNSVAGGVTGAIQAGHVHGDVYVTSSKPVRIGRAVSPQVAGLAPTVGRQRELHDLRAFFDSAPNPAVQVLVGMGGVGKSSLARAYAQRHLGDYGVIWWVRAEDPSAIDLEFRTLLEILLSPAEAHRSTDARIAVFGLLTQLQEPWLLVLDNVPDAGAAQGLLPPAGHGHILITTRATMWPNPTLVQPLDKQASVELLVRQSGDTDVCSAEALAVELDGLPLALTQAAGFVRANATGLATYLRLYSSRSAELHRDSGPADYPHTVATTWQLAMDRLTPAAHAVLNVLAFLAPEAVPVDRLFTWAPKAEFEPLSDELTRHHSLGELHAYSLVTLAGPGLVTIHRLIQAVTRNRLQADLTTDTWVETARALVATAMPEKPATARSLATWRTVHTHVRALLDHLPAETPNTMTMQESVAKWTGYAGEPAEARRLLAALADTRRRVLGADHPETLRTEYDIAYWSGHAGEPAAARDLLARLVPGHEQALGPTHPQTLLVRHELAVWTGYAGDPDTARKMLINLLPLRLDVLGPQHPDTLTHRNNVAYWTGHAGDAVQARDLFTELLPDRERVLGPEHPETLSAQSNIAEWTGRAGDPIRARNLFTELLPVHRQVLGPEHPKVLATWHRLALWTWRAGNPTGAQDLFAELLPVRERVLGADHPDTASTRRELESLGQSAVLDH